MMKNEKGVTLTALVIYVIFITATLILLGNLVKYMYPNLNKIGADSVSSEEFNKFNINFVKDIKESKKAVVNTEDKNCSIVLSNGANYSYVYSEKAIYRNNQKIAKNIIVFEAQLLNNEDTNNKNVIKVKIGTGKNTTEANFGKTINYVLRYW